MSPVKPANQGTEDSVLTHLSVQHSPAAASDDTMTHIYIIYGFLIDR